MRLEDYKTIDDVRERIHSIVTKAVPYRGHMDERAVLTLRQLAQDKAAKEFRITKRVRSYFVMLSTRRMVIGADFYEQEPTIYTLPWEFDGVDVDEKARGYNFVRTLAHATNAVLVATVSEAWVSYFDKPDLSPEQAYSKFMKDYGKPHRDPNRVEIIQVAVQTTLARPYRTMSICNIKRKGRGYLEPWQMMPAGGEGNMMDLIPRQHEVD